MSNAASKLEPHRQFIAAERKRGTTYRHIAELLAEKDVEVDHSTIHAFVKVRSKAPRKVMKMWEPSAENTSATDVFAPSAPAGTPRIPVSAGSKLDAIRRLKNAKPPARRRAKGLESFQPDAPLERVSEDEARRLRDELHRR